MTVSEIRKRYLDFFRARGHVVIPSARLVPENDPTTLFTSSGMQPLVPYLLGKPHPQGVRLADSQKSIRMQDIDEVGDNRHTTFFEMLGNWSLGDYFKKEQIPWLYTFLIDSKQGLGLSPDMLWITCFEGDEALNIPKDEESADLWESLGIPKERIRFYDAKKNWWSRSGEPGAMPAGEIGGPDTEVFFDFGTTHDPAFGETCHPNCDCGRFIEIANSVFIEYEKQEDGSFVLLPQKNVDFGGGLERLAVATLGVPDVFLIDTIGPLINELDAASMKNYNDVEYQKSFRIVADHVRAATFLIADGVIPANTDQGYILRRLIRRAVRHLDRLEVGEGMLVKLAEKVIESYRDHYGELNAVRLVIQDTLRDEEQKFRKTLTQGMKEYQKIQGTVVSGSQASTLVQTYGFPIEMIIELATEEGKTVALDEYEAEKEKHRELSRAGAEQKFKGGLADTGEQTTKLHTATHLMLAGLRTYVGEHVHQAGSNITAERTRFDFTHGGKVPRDILDKVEAYVNEAIQKACDVSVEEMPKEEAMAAGVEGSFWEKYPDVVNVYAVKCPDGTVYSRELCGGPHVKNTGSMGTFKITKEEASAAGVRRIKAVLT